MQRYRVTIVTSGDPRQRPTLVIPFAPSAIVITFVEEIFKRIAKQGLDLAPNTHIATLHLDSETGAIIDCEDILSDVIPDPSTDKLFAVFAEKPAQSNGVHPTAALKTATSTDNVSIRVITAASAKSNSQPTFVAPASATLRELHKIVAQHLHLSNAQTGEVDVNECNCKLARQLAEGPSPDSQVFVVHGKSIVQRIGLQSPTETAVKAALRQHLGQDLETKKKVSLYGAETHAADGTQYKKTPVVAVCAKHRHLPAHARVEEVNEDVLEKSRVLDLHTSESYIHPASMDATIEAAGLKDLAVDGVLNIFAVSRTAVAGLRTGGTGVGKNKIFRAKAHWEPPTPQSQRGIAMFLSSLRVFAALVQDIDKDGAAQDAVLHVFDLLTKFPPALRTLHILINGKTPTPMESAALSHACYQIMDEFMPTTIVGTDHHRVFEGSRLLFGFILEKARTLKLESGIENLPYMSAFKHVDLRDHKTTEAVMHAVQTTDGLVERALYEAQDGILSGGHTVSHMIKEDVDTKLARIALLTGGSSAEVLVFSAASLTSNYCYSDGGKVEAAIDLAELSELHHLAELCGRNKLAVHKPSELGSAVAPALTFDRKAHLAVYTGEAPCADPGQSSMQFRPLHGEETVDAAVIEQLIAPILQTYESDGTAVFDAMGGAAVRRLQTPDECLMFVVDCSASMRESTDFEDVDDDDLPLVDDLTAESLVEAEFFRRLSFEEVNDLLRKHEGFDDMVAIISESAAYQKRASTAAVVNILRSMLSTDIVVKHKTIEKRRERGGQWYYVRQEIASTERDLDKLKALWAGLKTHEEAIYDFLLYRASTVPTSSQRWTWSLGDAVPTSAPAHNIPTLSADITEVPDGLWCPISHSLMQDAVEAADGVTYSREAILKWFDIRRSSPMHGVPMDNVSLSTNEKVVKDVAAFISGSTDNLISEGDERPHKRRKSASGTVRIRFQSAVGSFERVVAGTKTISDLYKLAFRGLKARHLVFQLAFEEAPLRPSAVETVSSKGIGDDATVTIRIADDEPIPAVKANGKGVVLAQDHCLIKVYDTIDRMLFGFWTKKGTPQTMVSILWKYWRYQFHSYGLPFVKEKQVWTDMQHSGDNFLHGKPQGNTEQISRFLNSVHATGQLGEEKVYHEAPIGRSSSNGPLVLKVEVCAPWKPESRKNNKLTRLDVLKQMFEALINRMLAYGYKTHVGLITVGTQAAVVSPMSHVLENFRRATADMEAHGDTALWNGLALARDQLVEYGAKYPAAVKRVIVISDGLDTKSTTNTSQEVCWRLRQQGVLVDSVALGSENNRELRTISYLLGCYRFHPTSLVNALAICEMEPFLSTTERPPIKAPTGLPNHRIPLMSSFWNMMYLAVPTKVTADSFPARKEHPNLQDSMIQLTANAARPQASVQTGSARSNLRTSRLMTEMRAIVANGQHPKYDVYVSETAYTFWNIVMDGPEGSPYEVGTFLLYLHADECYPTFAPKARFITKIKHPNVNAHGRICHSIFDRDWTSDTSMTTLLDTVYGLMFQPETSDPVNTTTTLGYHHDQVEFADEVRDHVERHASKTREQWKATLLGEEDEEEANEDGDDAAEDEDDEDDDGDGLGFIVEDNYDEEDEEEE